MTDDKPESNPPMKGTCDNYKVPHTEDSHWPCRNWRPLPAGRGKNERIIGGTVRGHGYVNVDTSDFCGHCDLPRSNPVHELSPPAGGRTALPWRVGDVNKNRVYDLGRVTIADCYVGRFETAEANAAFIVAAVNHHARLVDALAGLLEELDRTYVGGGNAYRGAVIRAKAVLADAKGEGDGN